MKNEVRWLIFLLLLLLAVILRPQSGSLLSNSAGMVYTYLPLLETAGNSGIEWSQEAGNAQRTGYTPTEPLEPWTLLWTWNGPNSQGGTGGHIYNAPREARTITGGCCVFAPAGAQGIYALAKEDGSVRWHSTVATFNATLAYHAGWVFAGGNDGKLYKFNAETGAILGSYQAGNPINRGVLVNGSSVYALTDNGHLHKVNGSTMSADWVYTAGSAASMGLAYSASRDVIVFGTADLYIQAVRNNDGTRFWRVKPSPNTAGFPNEYKYYWPVVAEQQGVVFVRMRLDHNTGLWGYPSTGNIWPNSNAAARTFLVANPGQQNLFALDLDTGSKQFVPAVGYGGTEDLVNGQPYLTTGPVPVIKTLSNGTEVAYIHFRNGQSNPADGRWDSHMGEMVLSNSTISGLVAGDLRFVRMSQLGGNGAYSYVYLTDEQNALTMAGDTLFHAHWGASESVRITNRAGNLGSSFSNPIQTSNHPAVVRRMAACGTQNAITHWTTCGMTLYGDQRYWPNPGWWVYWNTYDPPTPTGTNAYSDGMRPRYTYVSDGLIIVAGNGGELMVFRHQ
jgi:outer membrane protein assembly factor BamB